MTDKMDVHKIHDLTSNSAHIKVSQITVYRNNSFLTHGDCKLYVLSLSSQLCSIKLLILSLLSEDSSRTIKSVRFFLITSELIKSLISGSFEGF